MFDLMCQMLVQFIECIPVLFGVWLLFSVISSLLFREK